MNPLQRRTADILTFFIVIAVHFRALGPRLPLFGENATQPLAVTDRALLSQLVFVM